MSALTEKLQSVEAERDGLLSEKEASVQTSTEEKEMLLSRLTSLSDERDQLQGILEELRHEKNQQRAELEERMEVLQAEVCVSLHHVSPVSIVVLLISYKNVNLIRSKMSLYNVFVNIHISNRPTFLCSSGSTTA